MSERIHFLLHQLQALLAEYLGSTAQMFLRGSPKAEAIVSELAESGFDAQVILQLFLFLTPSPAGNVPEPLTEADLRFLKGIRVAWDTPREE